MQTTIALLRLTRPDTSILIFLSVFLPLIARTGSAIDSFAKAIPTLFIAMCTFIVNDIDDIEADKINHPDRPLPSGHLFLPCVTVFYFICLALSLFTIKTFVPSNAAFTYYLLLILVINYKYVEEQFPDFKSLYVACVSIFPIFIVINLFEGTRKLYLFAAAAFFFVLGRELSLDFLDRAGDRVSFIHRMSRQSLAVLALALQVTGIILISPLVRERTDILAYGLIVILSPVSFLLWLKSDRAREATVIMKIQMYSGLYFLFR